MEDRRSVSLDALRGAAALSVAVPHFLLFRQVGGSVAEFVSILAVEVFFVLSGFVLAPQLRHCWAVGGRDVFVFYCRRWIRTLPPYFIILTCIALVTGYFGGRDYFEYAFFVRNLTSIKEDGEFFLPAWSLAVEEWFYFVFPIYLLVAKRLGATLTVAAISFIAGCYALKLFVAVFAPDLLVEGRRIVVFRVRRNLLRRCSAWTDEVSSTDDLAALGAGNFHDDGVRGARKLCRGSGPSRDYLHGHRQPVRLRPDRVCSLVRGSSSQARLVGANFELSRCNIVYGLSVAHAHPAADDRQRDVAAPPIRRLSGRNAGICRDILSVRRAATPGQQAAVSFTSCPQAADCCGGIGGPSIFRRHDTTNCRDPNP